LNGIIGDNVVLKHIDTASHLHNCFFGRVPFPFFLFILAFLCSFSTVSPLSEDRYFDSKISLHSPRVFSKSTSKSINEVVYGKEEKRFGGSSIGRVAAFLEKK
jgi:hypothetical protein